MNKRQRKKALKKRFISMNIQSPIFIRNHRIYDISKMADAFDTMLKNGKSRESASVNPDWLIEGMKRETEHGGLVPSWSIRALKNTDEGGIDKIISFNVIPGGTHLTDTCDQMLTYCALRKDKGAFEKSLKESLKMIDQTDKVIVIDSLPESIADNSFSPVYQHPINKPKEED